jgi:hypothetical protein
VVASNMVLQIFDRVLNAIAAGRHYPWPLVSLATRGDIKDAADQIRSSAH